MASTNLKTLVTIITSLLLVLHAHGQSEEGYKSAAMKFISYCYEKGPVSVAEFQKIYAKGTASYEAEFRTKGKTDAHAIQKSIESQAASQNSMILEAFRSRLNEITSGVSLDEMKQSIQKAKLLVTNYPFSKQLAVDLPNKKRFWIEVSSDTPVTIQEIWMPNGKSWHDKVIGISNYETRPKPKSRKQF